MKILLINPAFYDGTDFKNRFDDYIDWIKGGNLYVAPFEPPLGLAYLSAFLKERGIRGQTARHAGIVDGQRGVDQEHRDLWP